MITKRCPTCLGDGEVTRRIGYRHPRGGNPEPREVDISCPNPECEDGRVPDDEWEAYNAVLATHERTCPCGHRGPLDDLIWWDDCTGFLGNCQECGDSMLVPLDVADDLLHAETLRKESAA